MQDEDVEMIAREGFQQSLSSQGKKVRDPSKSTEQKTHKSTSAHR